MKHTRRGFVKLLAKVAALMGVTSVVGPSMLMGKGVEEPKQEYNLDQMLENYSPVWFNKPVEQVTSVWGGERDPSSTISAQPGDKYGYGTTTWEKQRGYRKWIRAMESI